MAYRVKEAKNPGRPLRIRQTTKERGGGHVCIFRRPSEIKTAVFHPALGFIPTPELGPPDACSIGSLLTPWKDKYQVQQEKVPTDSGPVGGSF